MKLAIWLTLSVVGLTVSVWDAIEAWHDLNVSYHGRETHRFVARRNMRRQIIRAAVLGTFLGVGAAAATLTNPAPWVEWGLIFAAGLVVGDAILDRVDRIRLHHLVDAERRKGPSQSTGEFRLDEVRRQIESDGDG